MTTAKFMPVGAPTDTIKDVLKNAELLNEGMTAATGAELKLPPSNIDTAGFLGGLQSSVESLTPTPEDTKINPSTSEIVGAAFRQVNTVGSALSSDWLWMAEGGPRAPAPKPITPEQLAERAVKDGLGARLHMFRGVTTEREYEAVAKDLKEEQHDREILAASGWGGTAAMLAAGIVDVPTMVPASRLFTIGKTASRLEAAQQMAKAGALDAAITEATLQYTQQDRTAGESAINVGASTVFAGALGFSLYRFLGDETADKVIERAEGTGTVEKPTPRATEAPSETGATPIRFKTAKGSTYEIQPDGTTVRNKAARNDPGHEGDSGIKPKTQATFYVDNPEELSLFFAKGTSGRMAVAQRGTDEIGIKYIDGPDAGKFEKRTVMKVRKEPSVGATPVEIWDDGTKIHVGNPIVKVEYPRAAKTEAAPKTDGPITRARSASAAAVEGYDAARIRTDDYVPSKKFFESLDFVGTIGQKPEDVSSWAKFIGDNLRAPMRDLETGPTDVERAIAERFRFNPAIKKNQVPGYTTVDDAGRPAPGNVAAEYAIWEGRFVEATHQLNKIWKVRKDVYQNQDTFMKNVSLSLVRNDKSPDPEIQAWAEKYARPLLEDLRSTLIKQGTMHPEAGPRNAESYMPQVYDVPQIIARKDEFIELEKRSFFADIQPKRDKAQADFVQLKVDLKNKVSAASQELEKKLEEYKPLREKALADFKRDYDYKVAQNAANKDTAVALLKAEHAKAVKANETKQMREARIKRQAKEMQKLESDYDTELKALRENKSAMRSEYLAEWGAKVDAAKAEFTAVKEASFMKNFDEFDRKFIKMTDDELEAFAEKEAYKLFDEVTHRNEVMMDYEVNGTGQYTKHRSNPARHEELINAGFARSHALDILEQYVQKAGYDASAGSVFRKTIKFKELDEETGEMVEVTKEIGDPFLKEQKKRIEQEYDRFLEDPGRFLPDRWVQKIRKDTEAKRETVRQQAVVNFTEQLKQQRKRALDNIDMIIAFQRRDKPVEGSSRAFEHAANAVSFFNYIRLMGGQLLSSLGDPVNIGIANGFARTMKFGIKPLVRDFRAAYKDADGDARRLARLSVTASEHVLATRMMALTDVTSQFSKVPPIVSMMRKAAGAFSKATGITFWTDFWKTVAHNVTQARIIENARMGWDKLSIGEQTFMNNVGLGKDTLPKILAQWEADGSRTIGDMPIGVWDKWEDTDVAKKFAQAVNFQGHNNIITPHQTDALAIMGTPGGRLALQFRRLMFAQQGRLVGRNLQLSKVSKDAGDHSDMAGIYSGLFGLVFMGAVIDATKHVVGDATIMGESASGAIGPIDKVMAEWESNPGAALYNAIDRSGLFGAMFEVNNIAEKVGLPGVKTGLATALGDEDASKPGSRFQSRSFAESAFGPTVGLLEDITKMSSVGTREFLQELREPFGGSDETSIARSDYKRAARLLPGSSLFYVRPVFNYGERELGNVFDWPQN